MSASSASKWIRYTWRRDGVRLVYYRLYCGVRTLYTLVCPALVRLSRNNESGNREFEAEYALAGEMDDGRVPLTAAETMAKTTHDLNDLAAKKMAHLIWKRATRHFDGVGPAFYRLIGGARTLYMLVRPPLVGCLSSWFNDGELGDREFEAEYALAGEMDDGRVPLTPAETMAKTTHDLNDLAAKKRAHPIWIRVTRHRDRTGPVYYRLVSGARKLYTLVRPPLVGGNGSYSDGLGRYFKRGCQMAEKMDDGRVPLTPAETLAKTTDNLNDLALPSDAAGETASALPSVDPKADDILETVAATAHDRPDQPSTTIVPAKKQRTEGPASPGVSSRSVNTQTDAVPVATATLAEHQQTIKTLRQTLEQTVKTLEQTLEQQQTIKTLRQTVNTLEQQLAGKGTAALAARPTTKKKKTDAGAGSDTKRKKTGADSELASDTIAGKYCGKQCEGTDCNARIAPRDQLRLYRDLHMFRVLSSGKFTLVDDDFVLSKSTMLAPGGKKVMKGWKAKDKDMDYKVIDAIMTRLAAGRMGMPATWEAYKAVRKTSGAICKDCWAKVVQGM